MPERVRVLAVVGLTGTGKTELACEIARRARAEVLSADSMQVYRGMDVGTAKPSAELRREVPHHGIDVVDPDEAMSAGHWAVLAREAAAGMRARDRAAILCGGTGLYARAFAGGLVEGVAADPAIRAELAARTTEELWDELRRVDPGSARRLSPGDRVRVERALEATRLGGAPLSAQHAGHRFADRPYEVRWIGLALEREALWVRLRERVDAMFAAGLVEEVHRLHAAGYGPWLRPLRSIGYREVAEVLSGRLTEAEAREQIWVATRRYAKRQRTWFRGEPGLEWIDAERAGEIAEEAADWLRS